MPSKAVARLREIVAWSLVAGYERQVDVDPVRRVSLVACRRITRQTQTSRHTPRQRSPGWDHRNPSGTHPRPLPVCAGSAAPIASCVIGRRDQDPPRTTGGILACRRRRVTKQGAHALEQGCKEHSARTTSESPLPCYWYRAARETPGYSQRLRAA